MEDDSRPDPDALLVQAQQEEAAAKLGELYIFLGMCPGVGKTYAMLQAARQRAGEGMNVLAGIVETHGRAETAALLDGLRVLPRKKRLHRDVAVEEFDLEEVLQDHQLVLVDELAHTNAPGSRHAKRYQDVLELIDAGIDVYTTLNVQHIESQVEIVRQVSGVVVRETGPGLDSGPGARDPAYRPERGEAPGADGRRKSLSGRTGGTGGSPLFQGRQSHGVAGVGVAFYRRTGGS